MLLSSFNSFESHPIDCSDDGLRHVKILVNGNAARGLTGDNYYAIELPFIVNGSGSWPESAYDYQQYASAQPVPDPTKVLPSITAVNPTGGTTVTVSSDTSATTSRPISTQRPAWVDRLGAFAVLAALLVVIGFIAVAAIRFFQQQTDEINVSNTNVAHSPKQSLNQDRTYATRPRPSVPPPNISGEGELIARKPSQENKKNPIPAPPMTPVFGDFFSNEDITDGELATENFSPGEELVQQSEPATTRAREDVIGEYYFSYRIDEPNYIKDDTEDGIKDIIDPKSGKIIGEVGMRISGRNKLVYPKDVYVFILEVVLFEKIDENKLDRQLIFLVSEYLNRNLKNTTNNRRRLTPKTNGQFTLESQKLLVDCTIENVIYLKPKPQSIFREVEVSMVVYHKKM